MTNNKNYDIIEIVLHFYIILLGIFVTTILGTSIGGNFLHYSNGEILRCIFVSFMVLFVVNLTIALLIRILLPKKWANPMLKFYNVQNWETKLYLKLGVRAWKDKIPEAGKIFAKFDKSKVENLNNAEYLYKFMQETIYGELIHFFSFLFGFIVFFHCKGLWHIVGMPLFITNMIINLMPFIVQRYNRPRLMVAYKRALRAEQTK